MGASAAQGTVREKFNREMTALLIKRKTLVSIISGIVLLTAGVFFLLSLMSYDAHDPPSGNYPINDAVKNLCGWGGAWIAEYARRFLGGLSYLLALLMIAWGIDIIRYRAFRDVPLRLIGGFLLFFSLSSILSLWTGDRSGGILGLLLKHRLLLPIFRDIGSNIIALVCFFISLLILTDMRVLDWVARACSAARGTLRRAGEAKAAQRGEEPPHLPFPVTVVEPEEERREEPAPAGKPARPDIKSLSSEERKRLLARKLSELRKKKSRNAAPRGRPVASLENELPPLSILDPPTPINAEEQEERIKKNAEILENTLSEFGIQAEVVEIDRGPVVTQYELMLAPGVKVGRVIGLSDDIAIAVKAPNVRIVAPIPGKSTVGIEVPNPRREIVRMREVLEAYRNSRKRFILPLMLGKDVAGDPLFADLAQMPHLLIAGATGSGKSVCINAIIMSLMMTQRVEDVRLLLVDPKMVELAIFKDMPHLMAPIVTDMKRAAQVLEWACRKMDERYSIFSRVGVRNITGYNDLGEEEVRRRLSIEEDADIDDVPLRMPHIIIIVDELADMMLIASKEVETSITRLSQKARAVGIHIIFATQRPSVDVVTGLIKANLPSRISFHVSSKVDSRTILDQNGAEKLLGMGDMLFLPPGSSKLIRAQGTFVTDDEIRRVIAFLRERYEQRFDHELMQLKRQAARSNAEKDEFYNEAVRIVLETERGSVSLLQRRLGIGYSRAARLIDMMAEEGIVGEYKGSQARETLMTLEEWEAMQQNANQKDS